MVWDTVLQRFRNFSIFRHYRRKERICTTAPVANVHALLKSTPHRWAQPKINSHAAYFARLCATLCIDVSVLGLPEHCTHLLFHFKVHKPVYLVDGRLDESGALPHCSGELKGRSRDDFQSVRKTILK